MLNLLTLKKPITSFHVGILKGFVGKDARPQPEGNDELSAILCYNICSGVGKTAWQTSIFRFWFCLMAFKRNAPTSLSIFGYK